MSTATQIRRARLAGAVAAAQPAGVRSNNVRALTIYEIREPDSGRAYAVVKLETRSGEKGYGECAIPTKDALAASKAVLERSVSAYEVASIALREHPGLAAAVDMALLDLAAKQAKVPIFQYLGGPTRTKARVMAPLEGETQADLERSLDSALQAGYKAFAVPVIPPRNPNRTKDYVQSVYARVDGLRKRAGSGTDFVLDGGGRLTAADAANLSSAFERFHLLWFDEPCRISNLSIAKRLAEENVTPLGFGRTADQAGIFQDLLREQAVDILRPDISLHGITGIRRLGALAETYYVAIGPYHNGGPIGTAAALQLAATLPNFFIQQIPAAGGAKDREMRTALAGGWRERISGGFASLPAGPGLGIEIDDDAIRRFGGGQA